MVLRFEIELNNLLVDVEVSYNHSISYKEPKLSEIEIDSVMYNGKELELTTEEVNLIKDDVLELLKKDYEEAKYSFYSSILN